MVTVNILAAKMEEKKGSCPLVTVFLPTSRETSLSLKGQKC